MREAEYVNRMDQRVTIQQEARTPDGAGGYAISWVDKKTTWARVEPIRSSLTIMALAQGLNISHRVTIRFVDYLFLPSNENYRLLWQGKEMKFVGMARNVDESRRFLQIDCLMGQMVAA